MQMKFRFKAGLEIYIKFNGHGYYLFMFGLRPEFNTYIEYYTIMTEKSIQSMKLLSRNFCLNAKETCLKLVLPRSPEAFIE